MPAGSPGGSRAEGQDFLQVSSRPLRLLDHGVIKGELEMFKKTRVLCFRLPGSCDGRTIPEGGAIEIPRVTRFGIAARRGIRTHWRAPRAAQIVKDATSHLPARAAVTGACERA